MDLCLEDLRAITGGCLTLAAMPPVRGIWEPVGRLRLTAEKVEPGDILWCLAMQPCDAELAYLRGALGVVGERRVEPWPGRFSLCVDNAASALAAVLGHYAREKTFDQLLVLKDLQLCAPRGVANFPLTCGQSAKGHAAQRCRRRAA